MSIELDSVAPAGYRLRIDGKAPAGRAEGKFEEDLHPRDRLGRFIETGAEVRVWGGQSGKVVRNVGGGRIEIVRSDGSHVIVHRNYLTVVARPDGSAPTAQAGNVAAVPVQEPEKPDAPEIDVPSEPTIGADAARDRGNELAAAITDPKLSAEVTERINAYHEAVNNDVPGDEADERAALRETLDNVQTSGGGDTDVDKLVSDVWTAAAAEPAVTAPDQPDAPDTPETPDAAPAALEGPAIADQLDGSQGQTVNLVMTNGDTVTGQVVGNNNGSIDIQLPDGTTDRVRETDVDRVERSVPAATEGNGTITNPDDPTGPASYEGPLDQAHTILAPGQYDATDDNGNPVTVDVTDDTSTVSPRTEDTPEEPAEEPAEPAAPAAPADAPEAPAEPEEAPEAAPAAPAAAPPAAPAEPEAPAPPPGTVPDTDTPTTPSGTTADGEQLGEPESVSSRDLIPGERVSYQGTLGTITSAEGRIEFTPDGGGDAQIIAENGKTKVEIRRVQVNPPEGITPNDPEYYTWRQQQRRERNERLARLRQEAQTRAGLDDRWTIRGNIYTTSVDKLKPGDVIYTKGEGTAVDPVELPSTSGGNVRPNARKPRAVARVERSGNMRIVHFTDGTSTGAEGGNQNKPNISGRVSVAGAPGQQPKSDEDRPKPGPVENPETMKDLGDLPTKAYRTQEEAEKAGYVFGGDTSDLAVGEDVVGFSRDRFRTARIAKIGRTNATFEYTTPTAIQDSLKVTLFWRGVDPEQRRQREYEGALRDWDYSFKRQTQQFGTFRSGRTFEVTESDRQSARDWIAANPDREAYAIAKGQKEFDYSTQKRDAARARTPQGIIDGAHMTTKIVKLSEIGRKPSNDRKVEPPPPDPPPPPAVDDPTASIENLRAWYRTGTVGATERNREFIAKLADEPSLTLSASGNIAMYKSDGRTWVLMDSRTGLSFTVHLGSEWGGKKQALVLADKYEAGLPGFDWTNAKQSVADWRSEDGMNMPRAMNTIKGKHDLDGGKDTLAARQYREQYGVTIEPDPPTPPTPPQPPEIDVPDTDVTQLDDSTLSAESQELSARLATLMNEQGRDDNDPEVAAIIARQREIVNERHRRIAEARRALIPEGEDVEYHELKPGDTVVVPFVTDRGPEVAMIMSIDGNQVRLRFDDGTEQTIYAVGQLADARWRRGAVTTTETVPSGDLQPGNRILLDDGTSARVEAITRDGDRVAMLITDENGVSRRIDDDRYGGHLRVSSDSSPEAIRASVADMSDDDLTVEAGRNLAAGSDGSPDHPLFKRQQAVYAEQRHRTQQSIDAVPVNVLGTDESTARPRLYTYQRKNLVALGLDVPSNGAPEDVQQAAARVRARLPLTAAQSEALRDHLDTMADDPSLRVVKQRSMRRLAQSFDASASVAHGRREGAPQPVNDRVQKVRITGLTAGDTAVLRDASGNLVTARITDVQPMMRGTAARVTYTDELGEEHTRIIDRDADVFLMPDLPPDKPAPVEQRAELEMVLGSDLREGDTVVYMVGGEYRTGRIGAIDEFEGHRAVSMDEGHTMQVYRDELRTRSERGPASADQPYLYTVRETDPETISGPDVQVGDRITVNLYDPPARGTVVSVEEVPAEGGGVGQRVDFADDTGTLMSITLFEGMNVQRTAKAAGNAALSIQQVLDDRKRREQRHGVRTILDEIQSYETIQAANAAASWGAGRAETLRLLDQRMTSSLRTLSVSRLSQLRSRLDTMDTEVAGEVATRLIEDVYARMRQSIEQAEQLPGESEGDMLHRVLDQHRDHPPLRNSDAIAGALLENVGELGAGRSDAVEVELPTITGEDLTARMDQYKQALGGRFGHRSMRTSKFGKLDLAALERGEAPQIEYKEQFLRDTAADDGPGEATMKQLAIIKAAGRDLDANLQDDIDARVRRAGVDIPEGTRVTEYMEQLLEMHNRLVKARKPQLDRMFDKNLTREEQDAARAEYSRLRDEGAEVEKQAAALQKVHKDAQRWAAKDLISKVRKVGGVRLTYQAADTTKGKNAWVRGSGKPLTERDKNVKAMRTAEDVLPEDWLTAIEAELGKDGRYNRGGKLGLGSVTRGHADYQGNIRLSEYGGPQFEGDPGRGRVAVHELGHFAQRAVPGLLAAERAFLWSRTSSGEIGSRSRERLVSGAAIGGDSSQFGYKDDFKTPYAGVDYSRSRGRQGNEAWEIITIGLESLFGGSAYLDEEYRHWLLGTLALV